VVWTDRPDSKGAPSVEALAVLSGGAGDKAGLREGDHVLKMNGSPIEKAIAIPQVLVRLGAWSKAEYLIERRGVEVKVNVYVSEGVPEPAVYYQYVVGLAYLFIGIFVYLRRSRAPNPPISTSCAWFRSFSRPFITPVS
jgi:two-component system, NtrC family, sensor kinase